MAVIYRMARRSEVPIEDASRLVAILRTIAEVVVAADVERRVDGIEKHRAGYGIREMTQLAKAA
jgi:hypothetical protein